MKRLKIEVFNDQAQKRKTVICGHIDASRHITVLSESEVTINLGPSKDKPNNKDLVITDKIDHFNIFEGMITIYYSSGGYIEITKI
jgi:hypothetical protein